jgi:cyclopropane fatty-acyl-phospholipid synthase-like methyltransferase
VGVDLADDAIKYCIKKYPGYTFHTCEMTKLPILNKKFDMICLFSVFTHMYPEEILEYLKDMKNYLNENGCIVASIIESVDKKFNGDRNKAEINKQYFMEIVKSSGYDKIVQLESDEYYEALKKTGNVVQITYKISR